MNNAQIDYLLQLPVPRTEPASPASRPRDDAPAFDNHFRQASEAGTTSTASTSPAAPPRSTESNRDDSSSRPPAAESDDETSVESTAAAAAETAADEPVATDDDRDADDAELSESAEAAVVLVATQQVAPAADAKQAAQDAKTVAHAGHPDGVRGKGAASSEHKPANAEHAEKSAAASTKAEEIDATRNAAASSEAAVASVNAVTGKTESQEAASKQAVASAVAESKVVDPSRPEATDRSPHGAEKSHHSDQKSIDKALGPDASEKAITARATATVAAVEKSLKPTSDNRDAATDDAPKKGDKKSVARTSATLTDATAATADRPAAARATDAPATTPTAATVQTNLPTVGTASAISTDSATRPKDAVGPKQGLLSPLARLERGAVGAHGTRRAGRGDGAPQIDPARFVSRVARAVHTAQQRGGPLQLRLSPPELGAMRLELSVNQGALTATIETDNQTAKQLLLDNLPALRDRLADQNVKIERFDVDVRRDPSGGQPNPGPQDRGQPDQRDPSSRGGTAHRTAAPQAIETTAPIRRTITNTSINVVA